jgi:hypothetical protein
VVEVDGASHGRRWLHRLEGRFYKTLQLMLVQHIAVISHSYAQKVAGAMGPPVA